MSDQPDSLVSRMLRRMDEKLDRIGEDVRERKAASACWKNATPAYPAAWIRWSSGSNGSSVDWNLPTNPRKAARARRKGSCS